VRINEKDEPMVGAGRTAVRGQACRHLRGRHSFFADVENEAAGRRVRKGSVGVARL
jgi:hypothetical protein